MKRGTTLSSLCLVHTYQNNQVTEFIGTIYRELVDVTGLNGAFFTIFNQFNFNNNTTTKFLFSEGKSKINLQIPHCLRSATDGCVRPNTLSSFVSSWGINIFESFGGSYGIHRGYAA